MFAEVSGLLPYTFLGHREGVCMREEKPCCSGERGSVTSAAASAKDGDRFVQSRCAGWEGGGNAGQEFLS